MMLAVWGPMMAPSHPRCASRLQVLGCSETTWYQCGSPHVAVACGWIALPWWPRWRPCSQTDVTSAATHSIPCHVLQSSHAGLSFSPGSFWFEKSVLLLWRFHVHFGVHTLEWQCFFFFGQWWSLAIPNLVRSVIVEVTIMWVAPLLKVESTLGRDLKMLPILSCSLAASILLLSSMQQMMLQLVLSVSYSFRAEKYHLVLVICASRLSGTDNFQEACKILYPKFWATFSKVVGKPSFLFTPQKESLQPPW